jgi:soluble lytic murein transglycosylase-like protein
MSFMRCCLGVLLLSALPFHLALARSETLGIPITIEPRYLDQGVGQALGMASGGRVVLAESPCNQVELSAPRTRPAGQVLEVELTLTAYTGIELMGACRGPKPWLGRMIVLLEPAVDVSGLAVKFTPTDARLIRADGKEGLFTKPVWALTQSLILPRLGLVRVDLAAPLAAIDSLISELFDPAGAASPLIERTRIRELAVVAEGLRATLGFAVAPRGAPPDAEPPLDPAELDAWATLEDELDGFLTTVIATLAEATESPDLRQELLGVLLDTRYAIALALAGNQPGQDPVRALFIDAWDRLRPHVGALDTSDLPPFDDDFRLAGFIAGGDALRALDALGPEYGVEITRDGLRRLARMLLAEDAPASFTPLPLEVDERLRRLFRLDESPGTARPIPGAALLVRWLIPAAHAGTAPAIAHQVPRPGQLQVYLEQVAALLEFQSRHRLANGSRIPERLRARFGPLVLATAWKESCWRQYVGSPQQPRVLKSPIGALGIMQINGRVWRGLYDLDLLADDIGYNIAAGIEILEHYLVDYALRRGEHRQPGGDDNLLRATYAAYNGGPGQLARYRRTDTPTRLQAIDNLFWDHYQRLRDDGWPEVSSCYPTVS